LGFIEIDALTMGKVFEPSLRLANDILSEVVLELLMKMRKNSGFETCCYLYWWISSIRRTELARKKIDARKMFFYNSTFAPSPFSDEMINAI
jgi:hypothetical protein